MFTPANQIDRVHLSEIAAAAAGLPALYAEVFESLCRGDSTAETADAMGVNAQTAGQYRAHTRTLLREMADLDSYAPSSADQTAAPSPGSPQ